VAELNAALGAAIPEDEGFETVAGFALARFGSIPRAGDGFEAHGVRVEVTEASPAAVLAVRVRRLAAE
jgi:CBS domain containing-hemolysin-like protein